MNKETKKAILLALKIGRDCAYEIACEYHEKMKGYRRVEHDLMDEDVAIIDRAIELLSNVANTTK